MNFKHMININDLILRSLSDELKKIKKSKQ